MKNTKTKNGKQLQLSFYIETPQWIPDKDTEVQGYDKQNFTQKYGTQFPEIRVSFDDCTSYLTELYS